MWKYINEQYVTTKVNGRVGNGKEYRKKYKVRGYPTVLLLNPDGTEIDRLFGWSGDKEQYFQTLVNYTNNKNTVSDLTNGHQQSPDDVEINYLLAKRRADRDELQLAKPYFENILKLDPEDKFGYKMESKGYLAVNHLFTEDDDKPLYELLDTADDPAFLYRGFNILIRYHSRDNKQDAVLNAYAKAFTKLEEDAGFFNRYAWYVYENRIKAKYKHAIKLTERALELEPEAHSIWDTLAWLKFESGKLDEAIEHMEHCIKLDPETKYYQDNLKKMKEARERERIIS
jgi:tetratricopeptide (TPR) repeat protein